MILHQPTQNVARSDAEIIVNTVNCQGRMGKGVALAMKQRFPEIMPAYVAACEKDRLKPGAIMLARLADGRRMVHLATKDAIYEDSRYEWVGSSLFYLNLWLTRQEVMPKSLCLPLPGAGNGGLDAATVSRMVRTYLAPAIGLGIEVRLCSEEFPEVERKTPYAGVGARDTPEDVLAIMRELGALAAAENWVLRSGGAAGADSAFHSGARRVGGNSRIFLPQASRGGEGIFDTRDVHYRLMENMHPAPGKLHGSGRELMARNGCQMFDVDWVEPSNLVICWTKGGATIKGTGQAIRIAEAAGIPVLNLGRPDLRGISAADAMEMAREMVRARRESCGISNVSESVHHAPALG